MKKILVPCLVIFLIIIVLWYPLVFNTSRYTFRDYFFSDRAKESRRAVSPATDSLASDIQFNAEHHNELPPDTVSELIDWLIKHSGDEYYLETKPYHINFENKKITGAYKEKIEYYKTYDGKYVLLSYGINKICEKGKGDDYLHTFDISLDDK